MLFLMGKLDCQYFIGHQVESVEEISLEQLKHCLGDTNKFNSEILSLISEEEKTKLWCNYAIKFPIINKASELIFGDCNYCWIIVLDNEKFYLLKVVG